MCSAALAFTPPQVAIAGVEEQRDSSTVAASSGDASRSSRVTSSCSARWIRTATPAGHEPPELGGRDARFDQHGAPRSGPAGVDDVIGQPLGGSAPGSMIASKPSCSTCAMPSASVQVDDVACGAQIVRERAHAVGQSLAVVAQDQIARVLIEARDGVGHRRPRGLPRRRTAVIGHARGHAGVRQPRRRGAGPCKAASKPLDRRTGQPEPIAPRLCAPGCMTGARPPSAPGRHLGVQRLSGGRAIRELDPGAPRMEFDFVPVA